MAIERYSSRGHALGDVLSARLTGAKLYLRIAGYFRSSLLEVVGEALETVGEIRVVCNGDLDPHDVKVARAAREGSTAVARTLVSSWQANEQGVDVLLARERYKRLHDLLASGKMKVRVIPRDGDNVFVHGKAGVIEHADGRACSFVGSLNDSASGLRHAYEILWADDDAVAAQWVRDEFNYFWDQGIDLPDAVVQHVGAMAKRGEYRSIEEAREAGKGAVPTEAILADRPIYKAGQILRPWQKRFVETCVEDFRLHGAAIGQGAPHVLGSPFNGAEWWRDSSIQYLSGRRPWPQSETGRWSLFRNPLPPAGEHPVFRNIRDDFAIPTTQLVGPRFDELGADIRSDPSDDFDVLAQQHNPIVRRVVRRTRPMLEEKGLLKPIAVITHPKASDGLPSSLFEKQGLVMGLAFIAAYEAAEQFSRLYAARQPGAGFLRTILLRRIGSSARAGLETARHLLERLEGAGVPEEERGDEGPVRDDIPALEGEELHLLREIERNLASVVDGHDIDPKVKVILHYLQEQQWMERNGAIIFSQYLTTADWVAEALSDAFPAEPIAVYAGGSASFIQQGQERRSAGREQIKEAIQRGDIRLVCATDAACEGLNLQRLGAQVNVDLPWNPSRLEQRKGRIQRIGQTRDEIQVLSLRYAGTVEDEVYAALSDRFGDIYSVLGQLPDGFEDDWIDAVIKDRAAVRHFSQRVETVRPPMELRYMREVADDEGLDWEYAERVLSSRDIDTWMREGW